jgi:thioredoxin reductase
VRMNMDELFDGGYAAEEGIEIARALEATGLVDYIHGVIGNNWGAPSYIQPSHYQPAEWSAIAGRFRAALTLPVVYTGRVKSPEVAEQVLASGHADVVGMARAMFAEERIVSKARAGRLDEIRPCIACNECLHTRTNENLPFGCAVNPQTGRETEPALPAAAAPRRVLVVGGGPAGLELAALLAERGHRVTLWERSAALGGQMHVAAQARENACFEDFIRFQERRLARLGVEVALEQAATADRVIAFGADVVALATGAVPRRPDIPGVDLPFVVEGRDVMLGRAETGARVAVIAMEDHMQPLTIAGFLTDQGKQVQLVCQTPGIAPLVGKYSIGAPLAKLSAAGATVRVMERVTAIAPGRLETRNVYSDTAGGITGFDSVVLACGGLPATELFEALEGRVGRLHILGDAYAPRRIWFATRQAYALAALI